MPKALVPMHALGSTDRSPLVVSQMGMARALVISTGAAMALVVLVAALHSGVRPATPTPASQLYTTQAAMVRAVPKVQSAVNIPYAPRTEAKAARHGPFERTARQATDLQAERMPENQYQPLPVLALGHSAFSGSAEQQQEAGGGLSWSQWLAAASMAVLALGGAIAALLDPNDSARRVADFEEQARSDSAPAWGPPPVTRREALAHGLAMTATPLLMGATAPAAQAGAVAEVRQAAVAEQIAKEPPAITTPSGLKYQDFKEGTGPIPKPGARVRIDYTMNTTGARYGSRIYSTRDDEAPFSFTLGDPAVIAGLNEAVSTMKEGGIRRCFISQDLGYTDAGAEDQQPIPPQFAAYQRWKNIYANPRIPYQPDLVMDIKLFKE
uniref:peptidylprolyl isomerase n=1 Tax=Eutreptiella gymnastica TaxID=73025 RepID=A0A7S1N2P7_9EUGL